MSSSCNICMGGNRSVHCRDCCKCDACKLEALEHHAKKAEGRTKGRRMSDETNISKTCPNCGALAGKEQHSLRDTIYDCGSVERDNGQIDIWKSCKHAGKMRMVLQQIATATDMTADALQDWAQDALRHDA